MLQWIFENTLMALIMAAGVCVACRYFRARPAVCHFLWALVLVRLIAPPVSVTHWPPASMRSQVVSWFDAQASDLSTSASQYLSLPGGTLLADNRSVSASSAAPVQSNPIEPALHPEEMAGRTPEASSPAGESLDSAVEGGINVAPLSSASYANSRKPDPTMRTDGSSDSSSEADSSMPAASEMTMSELKRQDVAWMDLYADKGAISKAVRESGLAPRSGAINSAARLVGQGLIAIWALGALAALVIHGRRIARFHAAVRRAPAAPAWLDGRVRRLAEDLNIAAPAVRVMPGLASPVIWGFGRPTLLWPADDGALAQRDAQRCDGIIVHELAHLVRRDHWMAWFEIAAVSLLWWHPLAHLACRRLHEFADLACDSWVVAMLPAHRKLYAASIVDLIEQLSTAPRAALALGVGTSSRRALVERRLIMIVKERTTCRLSPLAAALALLGAALLVPSWAGGAMGWTAPPAEVSIDAAIAPEHRELISRAILKRRAEVFYASGDWKAAAGAYQALYEASPDDAHAAHRLSYCLVALGELDRAQAIIEKQFERGNEPAIGHYNLACVLARRGEKDRAFEELAQAVTYGFDQLELVNTDTDLDALRDDDRFRAFAGDVNFVNSLAEQGQQAVADEDWDAAVIHFGKLARLAPNDGQAQHMLSYSSILASREASSEEQRDEHLNRARAAQQKQVELGHLPGIARYNMACVDALQGKVESGLENLAASIEIGFRNVELMREDPDLAGLRDTDRFNELMSSIEDAGQPVQEIQLALERGELAQARELIDRHGKAVDQGGGLSWALGYALYNEGEYEQAQDAFVRSVGHGHDAGDAVYNLACCEALEGNTSAALGYLEAAVDAGYVDGEHMKADEDLSALRGEKRFESIVNKANDARVLQNFGAVDWAHLLWQSQEALAKDSTKGGVHLRHGWALLRLGRLEEAMAAFTQQRDLGFAPSIASYNIACCQAALGQADAAIETLAQLAQGDHGGVLNAEFIAADPDLASLHEHPRFSEIIAAFAEHSEDATAAEGEARAADDAKMKAEIEKELELGRKKPAR